MVTNAPPASKQWVIQACVQDLRRIVKALEDYSRSVEKRFDLTGPQLWALWELGRIRPCALRDLAEKLRLDSSTVVGVVSRLVAKGLVVRQQDPEDGRRISLTPSVKGEAILAAAPHPAQGHLLAGLEGMDRETVEQLRDALAILVQVLETGRLEAPFCFDGE